MDGLLDAASRQKIREFRNVLLVLEDEVDARSLHAIRRNTVKYLRSGGADSMEYMGEADATEDHPAVKAYQHAVTTYDTLKEWEASCVAPRSLLTCTYGSRPPWTRCSMMWQTKSSGLPSVAMLFLETTPSGGAMYFVQLSIVLGC